MNLDRRLDPPFKSGRRVTGDAEGPHMIGKRDLIGWIFLLVRAKCVRTVIAYGP